MADSSVMTEEQRVAEMEKLGYTKDQIANRDRPRPADLERVERAKVPEPELPASVDEVMAKIAARLEEQKAAFDALPEEEKARLRAETAKQEAAELDAAKQARETRTMNRLREVPTRFRGLSIERPEIEQWAGEYLQGEEDPPGLLLLGPTGTRKTGNMWALYQHLIHQDPTLEVEVRHVPWLLMLLRPGSDVDTYSEMKKLLEVPLLMLDDLGANKDTPWSTETFYTLLDQRYAWMRPTIITSNLRPTEFGERLGDRLASRIREMSRKVVFDGQDTRREP